jgi:hypothetical protein
VPAFNGRAKRLLVETAQLDWREINPDIFGSMAVVDTEMRGDLGMQATNRGSDQDHPGKSAIGPVAELVGIEVGVVSGVTNLESSGVEASDWRLRHDEDYHEA